MIYCHAVIYLDKNNRSSTYCMREKGHLGEHSIFNGDYLKNIKAEDIKEEFKEPEKSKEQILEEKYGPYKHDEPKASRGF